MISFLSACVYRALYVAIFPPPPPPPPPSCGNQAYSVYPNGSLRWISEVYGEPNPYFSISPSLHPGGLLYFIHSNESVLIALSTQDGLLHKWYEITSLPYFEPPIIVGDSMIYLFGFAESSIVMYPLVIT